MEAVEAGVQKLCTERGDAGIAGRQGADVLDEAALVAVELPEKARHLRIARRKGETPGELEFAEEEEVLLSPLPCWRDWSETRIRARVTEMVEEIEKEAAADRESRGVRALGVKAILAQSPHQKPKKTKKSPAPGFHAATKAARLAMREAYGWFYAAYRDAADRLRKGERSVGFPEGSFPPALPFARGDLAQAWREAA